MRYISKGKARRSIRCRENTRQSLKIRPFDYRCQRPIISTKPTSNESSQSPPKRPPTTLSVLRANLGDLSVLLLTRPPTPQHSPQRPPTMAHPQPILRLRLRHRAPQLRRIKQGIISKSRLAHRLRQNHTFQLPKGHSLHLPIHRHRQRTPVPPTTVHHPSHRLQQGSIVRRIHRLTGNRPANIQGKPGRPHARPTAQRVYLQAAVVRQHPATRRKPRVVSRLHPRIPLKRILILRRRCNLSQPRQRLYFEAFRLRRRKPKIPQLPRIRTRHVKLQTAPNNQQSIPTMLL